MLKIIFYKIIIYENDKTESVWTGIAKITYNFRATDKLFNRHQSKILKKVNYG